MKSKEELYKSFKDLMKTTYDEIFSDENKKIFTPCDAFMLFLFGMGLDALNAELKDVIKKSKED